MKEQPTTLSTLRDTAYMKLLEYAANNAGKPFSREAAISGAGVRDEAFDVYVGVIYVEASPQSGTYLITTDALPKYIEFLELEEARAASKAANAEAKSARKIAIAATVIAGALASGQIILQVTGEVRLDDAQARQLVQVTETIDKNQAAGLGEIKTRLDAANGVLGEIKQNTSRIREGKLAGIR